MTDIAQPLPRFNGAEAWAKLTAEQQAEIGAIALEIIVNCHGEDAYFTGLDAKPEARPFIAAQPVLMDMLMSTVSEAIGPAVPALFDDDLPVPIPSLLGGVCRACACSEYDPCPEGCGWAEPDLCTSCAELAALPAASPPPEGGAR